MKILLVDNCRDIVTQFEDRFGTDHEFTWTSTAQAAIELLSRTKFDLVVLEWMLPIESGKVLLDWLHEEAEKIGNPVVIVYTLIPKEVKKFTNGHTVIKKYDPEIYSAINDTLDHAALAN